MSKRELKLKAVDLRKQGFSYTDIKEKIGVSKSTLSDWLKDLPYKPNDSVLRKFERARALSSQARIKVRIESEKNAQAIALKDVGEKMSSRDLLFFGLGLYMGEGSKSDMVSLANSDLEVIKLAIVWLKKAYGLRNHNFSIRIHLYPDSDIPKCLDYWARNTGLPLSQFHKVSIDRRTGKMKKHQGKLPYGTAHLTVKCWGNDKFGVFLRRRILGAIREANKNAGVV